MTNGEIADLMYEFFVIAVKLAGPTLIISMIVGIVIAIFQAATQIHESTVTFLPKLIVIALILVFTGGTMLETLQDFTVKIFGMML
ncbi:flagellar biosynthetic protein FliQ [Parasporobacterium paucivorans]|uniref:Flagellar biosynthetic protein FliQ n=1 Tax=Parasporobacterium paucivorans DSM 15970 TaxID=1122934 RepID=A0A1M6I9G5_9FIRM|nr:flagellar biosynthetic protein FliQ [Parasporobacterium paucivorans]SHJ31082.1 flagellar biosynthetic protein FliQ [Parasporobacterium paucivorans DSM 15970]